MKEQFRKLIDVKSIITFAIVGGVTYGFVAGVVGSETYCAFAGSIIAYYFTRKNQDAKD